VASALAVTQGLLPRELAVADLQQALIASGAKLTYFADVESTHPQFAAIQWAALRGFMPVDELLCFHPDDAIRWGDFVTALVQCLRIPVSVTSLHFENFSPREPCFRYCETLYDLGTRAGVDLFGLARLADEDPMQEFLRIFPTAKLLKFEPSREVRQAEAAALLQGVLQCLGVATPGIASPVSHGSSPLTRGQACEWLRQRSA
jgi:hypothetical protein